MSLSYFTKKKKKKKLQKKCEIQIIGKIPVFWRVTIVYDQTKSYKKSFVSSFNVFQILFASKMRLKVEQHVYVLYTKKDHNWSMKEQNHCRN